ncbi:MAG: hypothetical protein NC095_07700 [Muribaculum sp.]|nr:hypothetical protein [Muribaculum sp.]
MTAHSRWDGSMWQHKGQEGIRRCLHRHSVRICERPKGGTILTVSRSRFPSCPLPHGDSPEGMRPASGGVRRFLFIWGSGWDETNREGCIDETGTPSSAGWEGKARVRLRESLGFRQPPDGSMQAEGCSVASSDRPYALGQDRRLALPAERLHLCGWPSVSSASACGALGHTAKAAWNPQEEGGRTFAFTREGQQGGCLSHQCSRTSSFVPDA